MHGIVIKMMHLYIYCTFERDKTLGNEVPDLVHGHERAGAGDPEGDAGQADLLGGTQDGVDVGDEEAAAAARRGELGQHEILELRDHGREGEEQRGSVVPRRVLVGRGQAVGDGGEAEPRRPRQRARAARAEEAPPVVLGVDEGDVEVLGLCGIQPTTEVVPRCSFFKVAKSGSCNCLTCCTMCR